jgi:antitoxin StbD
MVSHMNIADILNIKTTVSMTELRRNLSKIIQIAEDHPVVVLGRNKPELYLLSPMAYEALLDWIDDASLIRTIKSRRGGKTIKVKI